MSEKVDEIMRLALEAENIIPGFMEDFEADVAAILGELKGGGKTMENDHDGCCGRPDTGEVIVSPDAVQLWPYIRTIVEQINAAPKQATFEKQAEAIQKVFLDAASVVRNQRKVTTVKDLRQRLHADLSWYKREVSTLSTMKRKVAAPNSKLKGSTMKQYRSNIRTWPKRRAELQSKIKTLLTEIRSYEGAKSLNCPGRLRVIYGGQYPAKLLISSDNGWGGTEWRKIR